MKQQQFRSENILSQSRKNRMQQKQLQLEKQQEKQQQQKIFKDKQKQESDDEEGISIKDFLEQAQKHSESLFLPPPQQQNINSPTNNTNNQQPNKIQGIIPKTFNEILGFNRQRKDSFVGTPKFLAQQQNEINPIHNINIKDFFCDNEEYEDYILELSESMIMVSYLNSYFNIYLFFFFKY
jgi:hypothetical protein